MIGEHFGVSIAEAMSAGLVPIVPAYSGSSEILPTEYQYHTLQEAADYIAKTTKYSDDEKGCRCTRSLSNSPHITSER